jgi:chemotaxis signal transduction protein
MSEIKKVYVDTDSVVYTEEENKTISILVDAIKKITTLDNLDVITYCKIVQEISKLIIDII